ncbi:uncharacterized protein LOC110990735 [Acanthaster planci]|uniref:Uncharacterized protein LOC110990735 n=1 Tax=Acanthaster planci TaxID=133434 RepID=A0A8B8A1H4_ACAPL|nr:uncharacterized protein LOC110990735 [Acanthaster planci]
MEKKQDGHIAFLDVEVSRLPDDTLSRTVYRKPTHTDRYLNNRSFHHTSIKAPVNRTLVRNTSHRIQCIFLHHGIKVFHTTPNKIQATLQSHKDKQDPKTKPGVYRIPCECGKVYIGETGRGLTTRLNEHRAHGRWGDLEKSAIIKHSSTEDHQVHWQQAHLIANIEQWYPRRVREAIEIHKNRTVPQDTGFTISYIWRPIRNPS